MKYTLTLSMVAALCFACGGDSGSTGATGQGGASGGMTGNQGGSGGTDPINTGGEGGMAMQGGGTLPTDVADCERGCLQARQCDVTACYSDVQGRLISSCAQACQTGDRAAFAALANAACPDAGTQAQSLLGIANQCIDQTSRCAECVGEGEVCLDGACGFFTCVPDAADATGNVGTEPESLPAGDLVLPDRTLCTGDEDWFSVELPASQNLFIDAVFVHEIGDVDVEVYDAADAATRLYSSASASDNESIVVPATNMARTLLIKIFPYREAQNKYELHLNFDVPLAVCTSNAQCPDGQECSQKTCSPIPPCFSDDDCGFGAGKCEVSSGICYECLTSEDCTAGVCDSNECVECLVDTDCEAGRCVDMACVECVENADCQNGDICLGSTCGSALCLDNLEPNNTEDTAVAITPGMQYSGVYICSDKDYYTFSIASGQAFIVDLTFIDAEGDIDATLSQNGTSVVTGVSTTDNETLFVPSRLAGGDYQLFVRRLGIGGGDLPSEQTYDMFINTNPPAGMCLGDEDCGGGEECDRASKQCRPMGYCTDNGDCSGTAETPRCDLGTNMCGPCSPVGQPSTEESPVRINAQNHTEMNNTCGGPDFFLLELPANKLVTIRVSFVHDNGDIDARLTDAQGMTAASGIGVEDEELLEVTSMTGGPHILKVYGVGDVYNEYTLQVTTQ